jgi:tetratricopeptide (TPR) repeat protein
VDPDSEFSKVTNIVKHGNAKVVIQARDIHGGIRVDAQAATSAPTALRQLPARVGGFIGRAADLSIVADLLKPGAASAAVVVSAVAGLAGIGKTALVIQAAHAAMDAGWFPGGVLFVDLHGYDRSPIEATQALDSLLRALGVAGEHIPDGVEARAGLFRSVLADWDGRVLVIADNASAARQVRPLLPGDARHTVLVTSRHTLPQLGARLLNLEILTTQEAVDLLDAALRAANPDDGRIGAEPVSAEHVARLCGRLPLALRITAARLAADLHKPLAELRHELADTSGRLAQFDDGDQAVRTCFDLSYQHLTGDQAYLFRLLGLHPGADLATSAAAVLAGRSEVWARRVLDELVRANMVQRAPVRGRWRMHDLIRDYARSLVSSEPADDCRWHTECLLDYYLRSTYAADQQLSPDSSATRPSHQPRHTETAGLRFASRDEALTWLEAERPNLHACVVLAATAGHHSHATGIAHAAAMFLRQAGYWQQAIAIHGIGAAAGKTSGDRLGQADSLNDLGFVQQLTGNYTAAASSHSEALELYRNVGDYFGQACALNNVGRVQCMSDRYEAAAASHVKALRLYRELGDRLGQGDALNNLGMVQYMTGQYLAAAGSHAEALQLYRDLGNRLGQADALNNLGRVQCLTDRYPAAISCHGAALRLGRDLGDRLEQANALNNLGRVQRLTGRYADAAANHGEALRLYQDLGNRVGQASAHKNLGTIRFLTDDYLSSMTCYSEALSLYRRIGDLFGNAATLNYLGMVWCLTGEFAQAIATYSAALRLCREIGDRFGEAATLNNLGRTHCLISEYATAAADHSESLRLYREMGTAFGQATAVNNLGSALCMAGNYLDAIADHAEALRLYRQIGAKLGVAAALNNLGKVRFLTEDYAIAAVAHTEALALYQELDDSLGQANALKGLSIVQHAIGDHAATANESRALTFYHELHTRIKQISPGHDLNALQGQPDKVVYAEE